MSRPGGHWAVVAVTGGVPYLKLDSQMPQRLCDPGTASPVTLPLADVTVMYGSSAPEVFALDSARNIWQLTWPGTGWRSWETAFTPSAGRQAAGAIAAASNDASHQAFVVMAGTRLFVRSRPPSGRWSDWGGEDLGRRLTATACSVSERHLAVFALDESGSIWSGVYALGQSAPSRQTAVAAWDTVAPPSGGVTGIAATALGARYGAADSGGVLVATTSDGAVHSAQYKLGGGQRPQWSQWREMPPLD
jgi:hypothetical protein